MSTGNPQSSSPTRRPFQVGPPAVVSSTRSSGSEWRPCVTIPFDAATDYAKELARSSPSNTELRKWAARPENRPPQSWWDETDDPFQAE